MAALLGHNAPVGTNSEKLNEIAEKHAEEKDQQERSTKKKKQGEHSFSNQSSLPKDYSDAVDMQVNGGSYRDTVLGTAKQGRTRGVDVEEEEEDEDGDGDMEGMKVEERVIGDYECPEFIFSKKEEKRLYRPWRRGVVVKLLGRRIGYKALETRLKQMWVRKGVINIIDLSNDYYLVAFTHEEDQYAALMDGPWFIYDHYLTVKEWSPNFHPASDTIKEVAVWLRISGLPIEYYDRRALEFIGNRIGKTVKVDKNTLSQERGKYARLCVQVNLSKPLLAMFTIKGRKYNIEYEGLHMLCTTCGRYGHYKEGCPEKARAPEGPVNGKEGESDRNFTGSSVEGPWRIVQKPKRNKKVSSGRFGDKDTGNFFQAAAINVHPARINEHANFMGSRFNSLLENTAELEKEGADNEENLQAIEKEGDDNQGGNQRDQIGGTQIFKNKRAIGGVNNKRGDGGVDRITTDSKLATRGGSFKNKSGPHGRRGVDSILNKAGADLLGKVLGHDKPSSNNLTNNGDETRSAKSKMDTEHEVSPMLVSNPNVPRPPNWSQLPPKLLSQTTSVTVEEPIGDVELFVDATDQGSIGSQESDMEVVAETLSLS
jgi:hypothetical protein